MQYQPLTDGGAAPAYAQPYATPPVYGDAYQPQQPQLHGGAAAATQYAYAPPPVQPTVGNPDANILKQFVGVSVSGDAGSAAAPAAAASAPPGGLVFAAAAPVGYVMPDSPGQTQQSDAPAQPYPQYPTQQYAPQQQPQYMAQQYTQMAPAPTPQPLLAPSQSSLIGPPPQTPNAGYNAYPGTYQPPAPQPAGMYRNGDAPQYPATGAGMMHATGYTHQTQTMVLAAPLPAVFGNRPQHITCPACRYSGVSAVQYQAGTGTFAFCCGLACIGCWLGCCLIPFCVNECQDATHYCPQCKTMLGVRTIM